LWLLAHLAQRGAFPFILCMPCQSMFEFFLVLNWTSKI
jgi:hypothetical protein